MNRAGRMIRICFAGSLLVFVGVASAQDWPQWRGPNRDGKATGFQAPATWPAALNKKWDVKVGEGDASPSIVGDRLYVFSREEGNEIIRSLNAQTGDVIWSKDYPASPMLTGDSQHAGPRGTPTVADGKVVTLGVDGLLSCWNAADGKELWQKAEFVGASPQFHSSCSPIVIDGLCIAQLGGKTNDTGAMIAYDLATGNEKWRVAKGVASYSSPVVMSVDGTKVVIAPAAASLVAVRVADGKLLWELPYKQSNYTTATPIVDGQTLIIAGPGSGFTALSLSKDGDALKEKELSTTRYTATSVGFNTPVLKDGALYGLATNNQLFCVVDVTGAEPKAGWAVPITRPTGVGQMLPALNQTVFAQQQGEQRRGEARMGGGQPQRGGNRRGGAGGGPSGFGSVVDAGSVLLALSPAAELVVFKPSKDAFAEVARYKVSEDGAMYATPVPSGNRIYIKDKDSIALWTME